VKSLGSYFFSVVVALVVLAAVTPTLINLSHALVPVLIVGAIVVIAIRLVFFHTRRF
jgi:hypothetical protein